ncbi:V-set and Ig domain-containing protein [Gadus macrocephalus]|uniref:V-set and Ig domain-containing protein n=1 Tax=Gadus macrocephalus TaxID=80720 RepID=UPI0028CB6921|nr:V-set and Ig domain-containing protein [Gadus macrocephalus]
MDGCLLATVLSLLPAFLGAQGSADDSWSMKVPPEVRATEGYPVVLPCSFSHPNHTPHSSLLVAWRQGTTRLFHCTTHAGQQACEASPHQDPRYRLEGNPREHDLSLRINSAALQDGGRYYCRVEVPGHKHASYEDRMGTLLRVEAPPRILSLTVQGSEDSGFRAQCEVEGSPLPDIQWVSPDHLLLEGLEVGRPPGQGSSPSRHHAVSQLPDIRPGQQYTCSATNPLGREQATLYLLPPRREACPGAAGPPLLLLLSLSLGAKALLLGGVGVWAVQGRASSGPICRWR